MISLLLGIFLIVLLTYGGGQVFIPMFENLLVQDQGIFTSSEYQTIVGFVNSLPGPVGGKLAAYSGYFVGGWFGFISASFVFILPAFLMMLLIYKFIEHFQRSKFFTQLVIYIKPIVIGIFLSIIVSFVTGAYSQINYMVIIIFVVSYLLAEYKKIPTTYLILASLIYGVISVLI